MFRQYYSHENPEALLENPAVLSVISFDTACCAPLTPGYIPTGLTSCSGNLCEVIECTDSQVVRDITGKVHWSKANDMLCAAVWITPEDCANIEQGTQTAYSELLHFLSKSDFKHPFRFWNFMPSINAGIGDEEMYKKFCVGRLNAFNQAGLDDKGFPAASAIGHHSEGAVIYVLASKSPSIHYENPRQKSAYHYPREYGPVSPSFARATQVAIENSSWCFVSGTASILGHQTQCPGDLSEQLRVTLNNIELLTQHIAHHTVKLGAIRVYVRHAKDIEACRHYLSQQLEGCPMIFTVADICRANLLVEIEANFLIDHAG